MPSVFYIIAQGVVYGGNSEHMDDETFLRLFSQKLNDELDGPSVDSIRKWLRAWWGERYDTIYPFGDSRQTQFATVWTFDLDRKVLLYYKLNSAGEIRFDCVYHRRITFKDFETRTPPMAPISDIKREFSPPYWQPLSPSSHGDAFTYRLLNDFGLQWRHILRQRYNEITFGKMATAIIRLVLLDFCIEEVSQVWQVPEVDVVDLMDLPEWHDISGQVYWTGSLWIVSHQNPEECLSLIRKHFQTRQKGIRGCLPIESERETRYLALTVRHVTLCRFLGDKLEWTSPETLFDGKNRLSVKALELLRAAVPQPPPIALSRLPTEIQDLILSHVSETSVEAARVGCVLGIGSPFHWKDGGRIIERQIIRTPSPSESAFNSEIWFGGYGSGLVYRPVL